MIGLVWEIIMDEKIVLLFLFQDCTGLHFHKNIGFFIKCLMFTVEFLAEFLCSLQSQDVALWIQFIFRNEHTTSAGNVASDSL